jgi:CRISPR-associated endonuclease/helicase Cas3
VIYPEFFEQLTGHEPYPYQRSLAEEPWPQILDIPTGLGKTAAVLVAWLWKRLHAEETTGRRIVYCLPMRVLVNQTAGIATELCERAAPSFEQADMEQPTVHQLMGGFVDEAWEHKPENPAVLVGTQDMLLSRALNRGYV